MTKPVPCPPPSVKSKEALAALLKAAAEKNKSQARITVR